jgi:hypothetical protein
MRLFCFTHRNSIGNQFHAELGGDLNRVKPFQPDLVRGTLGIEAGFDTLFVNFIFNDPSTVASSGGDRAGLASSTNA